MTEPLPPHPPAPIPDSIPLYSGFLSKSVPAATAVKSKIFDGPWRQLKQKLKEKEHVIIVTAKNVLNRQWVQVSEHNKGDGPHQVRQVYI